MQYNLLPPWRHEQRFTDRYDWRSDGDYWDYRTAFDALSDDYNCEIMKWGELRLIAGGGTSVVGTYGDACISGLARDLDEDQASGIDDFDLYYSASTVTDNLGDGDGEKYADYLDDGRYGAVINHVAEGVGGSVRDEIDHMLDIGMSGPGFGYVHATDGTTEQFARMAADGTSILWSPRSNLDLYAATTAADVAHRMGVPLAIGPDWTWSGSANVVEELECAWDYLGARDSDLSDADVYALVTTDAAAILGLDGVLGGLFEGAEADISVFSWSAEPYRSIVRAGSEDVRLVVIGGEPVFGVPELVSEIASHPDWCETVTACTETRTFCVQSDVSGTDAQTLAEIESTLTAAMAAVTMPAGLEYAGELFGLFLCEDERPACEFERSDGDADGDGVADGDDLCPTAYDPLQDDHDDDGVGDACDACPLGADIDDCRFPREDVDDDGVRNDVDLCPWLHDDQSDGDADGKGDACDLCPDEYNPGDAGCTLTVDALRDPSHASHPEEGDGVTIDGLVVTGVRAGYGYLAQDPDLGEWGGVYVYDGGDATVELGDVVTIAGTYMEYYGMTEVAYATTEVTGTADLPEPIAVSDPCSVATGGADAERYESMLVSVVDVVVSSSNPDAPSGDYGEWEVDACLRVDDWLCADCWTIQPSLHAEYDAITGPLIYTFGHFKLAPRSSTDLAAGGR